MRLTVSLQRATWIALALFVLLFAAAGLLFLPSTSESAVSAADSQWANVLDELFAKKNDCLLTGKAQELEKLYAPGEQNSSFAKIAESKRSTYLRNWAEKQDIRFISIISHLEIRSVKKVGRGYAFFLAVSTEYKYAYSDTPDTVDMFRIGTYHTLDLIPGSSGYVISREWYLDPFDCSLLLEKLNSDEIKAYIRDQHPKDLSELSGRRKKAVAYANRYCGAAADDEYGYSYNASYPNFNFSGGDCTNFISQALQAGGFKRNSTWNVTKIAASRAWCNAQGFKDYMIYSGRAQVLARGNYKDVYKAAYKLMPGDIVSYAENGKIVHNSIVTGFDSKGYPLVNSHTTDRYRVPWDMGWNDSDITFYLLHVNY